MAARDEHDPSVGLRVRLAECPELATGTVLHVHHSPVIEMLVVMPGHDHMVGKLS
jgi:hypothetical protein